MKIPRALHCSVLEAVRILLAAIFLIASRHPEPRTRNPRPKTRTNPRRTSSSNDDWRTAMAQLQLPKKGCFESSFPARSGAGHLCRSADYRCHRRRRTASRRR
jgi:hypothetical protein